MGVLLIPPEKDGKKGRRVNYTGGMLVSAYACSSYVRDPGNGIGGNWCKCGHELAEHDPRRLPGYVCSEAVLNDGTRLVYYRPEEREAGQET